MFPVVHQVHRVQLAEGGCVVMFASVGDGALVFVRFTG